MSVYVGLTEGEMSFRKVAIDGPAGAGKSTISRAVARELEYVYIDTGAMYRACALKMIRCGIDINNEINSVIKMMDDTKIEIAYGEEGQIVYLDGEDITGKAGNISYISSEGIYVDTVAPEVSGVEIKTDGSLTGNALTFGFVSNEPGTYYYAVMPASAQAPDAASIKSHLIAKNAASARSGTVALIDSVFHHVTQQIKILFHNLILDFFEFKSIFIHHTI